MNYREYVGPEERWDLIAGHVFSVLYERDLRGHHRLLDIGCGSMRIGRLLIPYLDESRYMGFDPKAAIIDAGIENEVGSLAGKKKIRTQVDQRVPEPWLEYRFDYVLAHSIFTHAPKAMIQRYLLETAAILRPGGLLLATFMQSEDGELEGYLGDTWQYPGCVDYPRAFLEALAWLVGLEPLPNTDQETWHPGNHSWLVCRKVGKK